MKIRVQYRRIRVTVEHDKLNVCQACDKEGRTELHHWLYAYSTDQVRASPQLALENTDEYCFLCHKVANAIRFLVENEKRARLVRGHGGAWRMYKAACSRGSQS
jgi:hypothetical protein